MDITTISFVLGVIALLVVIISDLIVPPEKTTLRRVFGGFFIIVTIFFCFLGFFSYLRDRIPITLPSVGFSTPTPPLDVLSDDFSKSQYKQGYNPNLWYCHGCEINNTMYENGSIRFEIDSIGLVDVVSVSSFRSDQIRYLEGKLNLSEYEGQNFGGIHLFLGTEIGSGWWSTGCYIELEGQPGFACAVVASGPSGETYEYETKEVPVNYGEWHTAKIELDSTSFELRFYLDNKIIGNHVPSDANELKGKYFTTNFGITSFGSIRHIVGYADDIILSTIR